MRVWLSTIAALVLAAGGAEAAGPLFAEGGGITNPDALKRFAEAVHGAKSVCFITTASPDHNPGGKWLQPAGLHPDPILVTKDNADSKDIAARLSACDGFYFDGGAPALLSDAFLKNGHDTLALATIRKRNKDGLPVGGASAGAMILGPSTMCACGLHVGIRALTGEPVTVSPAFAFVPVPLDAHALRQNLYNRELFVMGQQHWQKLVALDEGAAVEIPGDGTPWRVIGDKPVALMVAPKDPKSLSGFDISFLHQDDTIDPATLEPITTGRKALPHPNWGWVAENLQTPPSALSGMAYAIANGSADAIFWDAFWYPDNPVRLQLKWTDKTAAFEGLRTSDKGATLLTHLSLSFDRPGHDAYKVAVTIPFENRFADRDWRIAPLDGPCKSCLMDSPTPNTAPGVTLYDHTAIKAALGQALVVNVLPGTAPMQVLPGSIWMSGPGQGGSKGDAIDTRFAERLKALTGGDRDKVIVFYCAHAACWWSYNAAQRAKGLGYRKVGWYRGGLVDWANYDGATVATSDDRW